MTPPFYANPKDAEIAFYDAFQRLDVEAMMHVWAEEDTIVCIHPMGPRLSGRRAVTSSWRQIFDGSTLLRFELTDIKTTQDGSLAVHCLNENISFGPGHTERSVVFATNVYTITDQGWRIVVHHASPGVRPAKRRPEPAEIFH